MGKKNFTKAAQTSICKATNTLAKARKHLEAYQSAISAVQHLLNDAAVELSDAMADAIQQMLKGAEGDYYTRRQLDEALGEVTRAELAMHSRGVDADGQIEKLAQHGRMLSDVELNLEWMLNTPKGS